MGRRAPAPADVGVTLGHELYVPAHEDATIVKVVLCAAGHRTEASLLLGKAVHGVLPLGPFRNVLAHLLLRAAQRVVELDVPRRRDHHRQEPNIISDVDRDENLAGLQYD